MMTKIINKFQMPFSFLCKCFYYSALASAIIMQVGCAISKQAAEENNVKAKASLSYGKSKNVLVAQRTGELFY